MHREIHIEVERIIEIEFCTIKWCNDGPWNNILFHRPRNNGDLHSDTYCICIYTHSLERTFQNRVLACNRVYRITNSRRSKHLHFPITPTDVMQFNSPSPPRDSLIWFEQLTLDDSWRQSHRRNDVSREWNLI